MTDPLAVLRAGARHVPGEGTRRPLCVFMGEAPGAQEDRYGRPFVGRSGDLLRRCIQEYLLLDPERDCYITNVVKYRPPGNRTPTRAEVDASKIELLREIAWLHPRQKLMIPLGATALKLFSRRIITEMAGQVLAGRGDWLVYPLWHPSYVLRDPARLPTYQASFAKLREVLHAGAN